MWPIIALLGPIAFICIVGVIAVMRAEQRGRPRA